MAKRRRRSTRTKSKQEYPPWLWMLFGLSLGLSVAFAVYVKDRRPSAVATPVARQPASLQGDLKSESDNDAKAGAAEAPAEKRFTFYDLLPNFEVVVSADEPAVAADAKLQAVVEPGTYVLQAGSFSTHNDADRRRAELALQGIESNIQRVKVNDRNYYRVYVGPTDDLNKLNLLRSRLHAAQIEVLRIRLSD